MKTVALLFALSAIVSGCGSMNRAVGVLPNTLEDLEQRAAAQNGEEPQ